ncbi:MAG: BTAD domain-containing putative transcriptional regulator [Chloroflexota bacterium]
MGPGIPGAILLGAPGLYAVNPFPITGARIHRPLLRADTLSRERLNGWLDRAVTGRLALIIAEAGFGKTTLLADWSRHTERLTAWYRLEPDDRDWLTVLRHLVASGRELDPDFAAETYARLLQLGPGGPTQAELVTSLVRDMSDFASAHPQGFTLIFDDYHAIDRCEETEPIVRAILDRTGPGFSVIIASRAAPRLPLGRLRSRGGVARLDGDDLCFDVPEADRLFRDAYRQPLEPDIVTSLIDRTEGWPALLSLVHTNIDEGGTRDARGLVQGLSATGGDLYDYMAEEVTATLSAELRAFLTRASLLDWVDVEPAALVDDRGPSEIAALIRQAEELGLLGRPDSTAPHRFHPLVRDFLRGRLLDEVGEAGVREMHLRLAVALERKDWRASAAHYLEAGDIASVERVLDASLEQILASGLLDLVRPFLDGSAGDPDRPSALLLRSRAEMARGNLSLAVDLARRGCDTAQGTPLAGITLLNLATVLGVSGFPDEAMRHASDSLQHQLTSAQRDVALATVAMWEARHTGDLAKISEDLRSLIRRQDRQGHVRYASISRLNLASVLYWRGEVAESLALAAAAEAGFRACGAPDLEIGAALAARATALAFLGRLSEARALLDEAASSHSVLARDEAALETAKILSDFGDADEAVAALNRVGPTSMQPSMVGYWALVSGQVALRMGDTATAARMVDVLADTPCHDVAGELRGRLLKVRVAIALAPDQAADEISALRAMADAQSSRLVKLLADALGRIASDGPLASEIVQLMPSETGVLSMIAEEITRNLHRVAPDAKERVFNAVAGGTSRWSSALRLAVRFSAPARPEAALALSEVGTVSDVDVLRSVAGTNRAIRLVAARLARRLAPIVTIQDLGAVEVRLGERPLGRSMRRKVLGLLCFLASRPNMAATRDEALDALWPDLGPDTAANSLHQTIYFLRRVFEPEYREGYSAGYVLFDGDVVSLDEELVDSTSRQCWRLVSEARRAGADVVFELLRAYSGRYALDFMYEDWASDYRDTLHAAVLATIEHAIANALASGDHDQAIELAQGVLVIDPGADSVELTLLRAYKASGRYAAAAEQYAHYSSVLRDELGVEPPRLEEI